MAAKVVFSFPLLKPNHSIHEVKKCFVEQELECSPLEDMALLVGYVFASLFSHFSAVACAWCFPLGSESIFNTALSILYRVVQEGVFP